MKGIKWEMIAQTPLGRGGAFFVASQIRGESTSLEEYGWNELCDLLPLPALSFCSCKASFFITLVQAQLAVLPPTELAHIFTSSLVFCSLHKY